MSFGNFFGNSVGRVLIVFGVVLRGVLGFYLLTLSLSTIVYAENNPSQLRKDIQSLDKRLSNDERKVAKIRGEVRVLEKKLGVQTRKAYSLNKKIDKLGKRLEKTIIEKEQLDGELKGQKRGLSQQMQALYTAGEQSHLRLLLKQDDPSDIGRTIKYFEYLNKSRIKKIKVINETLLKLRKTEVDIAQDKTELQQLRRDLLVEKKASKRTLDQRTLAFKKINKNVSSKKRQLRNLRNKEAKLEEKINRLVARTKKASVKPSQKTKPSDSSSRQAKTVTSTTGKRKVGVQQKFIANRKFSTLRGKLSWPVQGRIIHAYGSRRNEKQRWKGSVIAAPGGRKVRAIARGKVEFSGWFNGYGYLVIIRHDNNYRSLYGYNRAIYVKTGQIVKGGTTIAAVGNSGGQQQNALYFEIRKGSKPRNPAKWCR